MKTKIFLWGVAMLWLYPAFSQISDNQPMYGRMLNDTTVHNFYDIQREFNNYFIGRNKGRGSGYKQFKRLEDKVESAYYPSGRIFNIPAKIMEGYQNYVSNFDNQVLPATYDPGSWTSMGPSNHTLGEGWNGGIGRVNCIAFHPSNASVYYAGTPAGGLWKFSATWQPLTDGLPSIGVSGIAVDPNNSLHIFILSGDGDGGDTYSIGVLETRDGGVTWQTTGLIWGVPSTVRGYKLLMHPENHDILFTVSSDGIHKTIDGGVTWVRVKAGSFKDIEFNPGDPSVIYAVTATRFYKSTDTGDTWPVIAGGLPAAGAERIGIGVTPNNSAYVYLIYGQSSLSHTRSGFMGCYRSTDNGNTFFLRSSSPNIFGYPTIGNDSSEQASYDLALAVSPTNANVVHFGGINCWKSPDGGATWNHTSYWKEGIAGEEYTHADIHALEFNPLNNYLYCGSDGGFYRSTDNAANWSDLSSGLVITEFYRMGGTQQNVNLIAAGAQDNGCNTFRGGSVNTFIHDAGADGFECMIHPGDSNIRYESTYAQLYRTSNNGSSWSKITPGWVDEDIWNVAWSMHPTTPSTLFLGHFDIWKTTNSGSAWNSMGTGNTTGRKFRQIAHGVNNLNRIYGLTALGVYMTNNGGGSWTNITAGLPVATCELSYIAVDPTTSDHVVVTCLGFVEGEKVYESINAGTTWTQFSGTLPNVQARCIVYENGSNDRFYLGTDIGVFYRDDNTNDWVPFFNGLPNTIVSEMEINYNTNELVAATFGRGFWKTSLYGHCPVSYVLTPANNPGTSSSQYYAAENFITSTRYVYSSYNSTITYRGGNNVTMLPGFEAESGSTFEAVIGDCPSGAALSPAFFNISQRTAGGLRW